MPTPRSVVIKDKRFQVVGLSDREPVWRVRPTPVQDGDPLRERSVRLGRGSVGLIGKHRHSGLPSPDGIYDSLNADTSQPGRYGPGPAVTALA